MEFVGSPRYHCLPGHGSKPAPVPAPHSTWLLQTVSGDRTGLWPAGITGCWPSVRAGKPPPSLCCFYQEYSFYSCEAPRRWDFIITEGLESQPLCDLNSWFMSLSRLRTCSVQCQSRSWKCGEVNLCTCGSTPCVALLSLKFFPDFIA